MRSRNRTTWKVLQAARSKAASFCGSGGSALLHRSHRSWTGPIRAPPADRSGSNGGGPQLLIQRSNSRPEDTGSDVTEGEEPLQVTSIGISPLILAFSLSDGRVLQLWKVTQEVVDEVLSYDAPELELRNVVLRAQTAEHAIVKHGGARPHRDIRKLSNFVPGGSGRSG